MQSLCRIASEITCCEIRCFYYLYSKVITMKNNSSIIINRDTSLFVTMTTTFLLSFDKERESI